MPSMQTRLSIIHSKRPLRRELGTGQKTAALWLRTSVLVLVLTYSPEYYLPQTRKLLVFGTKLANDMITVGIFCNATGSDFWKPCVIGTAKKPRCFGNHWIHEKAGCLYYHNDFAWIKGDIWLDILRKFNAYGYDKRTTVLLVDNCSAHKPHIGASMWQRGNMQGYKMSNVLVIYFEPNCTSHVQPLDAGCIQTAKAFYRKRHMSWVLQQLSESPTGERAVVKCNIRQAIE